MSFLFSIILIATFGCYVRPFLYKAEVDYYEKNPPPGKASIVVYMKSYDMLYETQDITFCDRGSDFRFNRCDYIMAYQFCFANLTPSEKWLYTEKNFIFTDSNTVKFIQGKKSIDESTGGKCFDPIIHLFPAQRDYFYYDYPDMIRLKEYKHTFTFQTGLIVDAGEEDSPPNIDVYGTVYAVGMRPNLTHKYTVHRFTKYIPGFESTMMLEVALQLDCVDRTGQTCWLKCTDDKRQKCKCDIKFRASAEPCIITCKNKWLSSRTFLFIEGFRYTLNTCVYKDWCYNHQCPRNNEICIQTGNGTGNCGYVNLNITTQLKLVNMTNLVFFALERVTIFVDTDNVVTLLIMNDITLTGVNIVEQDVFKAGVLNNYQESSEIGFRLLEKYGYVDENFTLVFKIDLFTWNKTLYKFKTFRIFVRPSSIFLWQKSGQETMRSVIIFGDHITCNSTGAPKYRIIIGIKVQGRNTKVKMGGSIYVPTETSKVEEKITCLIQLFSSERNTRILHLNKSVIYRVMQYFEWRPKDNIILNTVLLRCMARTYFEHSIKVFMLRGPYDVWAMKNSINLTMVKGGIYTFCCILTIPNATRSLYKEITVRALPTKVCFFLFARVRGALLQCSHDGYLKDEYNVTVSIISVGKTLMTGTHAIRIPYEYQYSRIKINCSVTALYKRNYQLYKTLEIEIERSILLYLFTFVTTLIL